jgi:broad specificity phosphatase PhoE
VRALAAQLASVPLDAIVASPREHCRQTAEAIAAVRDGHSVAVHEDQQLAEVATGLDRQAAPPAGQGPDVADGAGVALTVADPRIRLA